MHTYISFSSFCDAFRAMDRGDQFSYDGKKALYDYLEELEDSTGALIELDVIALCCEYTEYESAIEAASEMSDREPDPDDEEDANEEDALDYLRDRTTVLEVGDGRIIIADF